MLLLEKRGADVIITEEGVKVATTVGQEVALEIIKKYLVYTSREEYLFAQFYKAAEAGKENTIHELLAQGVKPDLKDSRNVSPLWIAVLHGHLRVVELLLDTGGVDINLESISGRTPIFWAAAHGYEDIVGLLLRAGADPNLTGEDGRTPLSIAKHHGHGKIVSMLAGVSKCREH